MQGGACHSSSPQQWAHPHPALKVSLTLLSSGVGGRGFFEAETRKTEKENEPETEHPQPEVSCWGLFREKGPSRGEQQEQGAEGAGDTQKYRDRPC